MRRRLERRIYVPPPDTNGREAMLKIHTTGLKLAADVDLAELADRLEGIWGADVQLARDAAMAPICVEIKNLRRVRAESSHRPPRQSTRRLLDGVAMRRWRPRNDLVKSCRGWLISTQAPMRAAIAGKSPDEIVELQTKGELEGEITSRDFLGAVETTPPSIAPGSLKRFEAWNAEFGCELRPPPAREAVAEAPAAAPPKRRRRRTTWTKLRVFCLREEKTSSMAFRGRGRAARAPRRFVLNSTVNGCAPPNTRRAIRVQRPRASSTPRRSSSVAARLVERPRVNPTHLERESMTISKNASRHRHHFAQQRLGFFEAPRS